jgi:DNA-binding response OmpR family regulator
MSHNPKIMVVDDEPDLLKMVTIYLKKWNFDVSAFADPIHALKQFESNPSGYDLVITDIRMPHMTGIELANHLLRIKPDVKVMLMTAFDISDMELQSDLPIIKHSDILKKPFRLVEICNGVKKQLQIGY